jgi:anthranilate/para-aminobenzoate synthase component I
MLAAQLDVPADPLLIARALERQEALVLVRADRGSTTYVACDPSAVSCLLDPEPDRPLALVGASEFPRWIGLLPYEARRTLERERSDDPRAEPHLTEPLWRRYQAVIKITNIVEVLGEDPHVVSQLRRAVLSGVAEHEYAVHANRRARLRLRPVEAGTFHVERVQRALELIRAGELYQVNLARRFELDVEGAPLHLFAALVRDGWPPYAALFDWPELTVVAASPELFLATDAERRAITSPIKGTRPRHPDPQMDRALAQALDADPKERAELAMIIDVERNDLGRLALPGSVRLRHPPAVESHARVHHRAATIQAALQPQVTRAELLEAMLPSGSVTGAPKVRAMDAIRALEPVRRGLYTGAYGILRQDGGVELGMAIRTLTVKDGSGHYYAGGGIVADSDPERELEETLWKAAALLDLAGANAQN